MNVAILYICTGRYTVFWDNFFTTAEKNFLPRSVKKYFVFTDGEIGQLDTGKVVRVQQENLGWPGNTLKRFAMFRRIADQLSSFDYIFFCNANMLFMDSIGEEIVPSLTQGIVVVQHPGFYNKSADDFTYERNPESKAYIGPGEGKYYVCGGFNGGHASAYLRMIDALCLAIEVDEKRGLVAVWHDESHLNRYIVDNPHKLLGPDFCSPEGWNLPVRERIRVLDKNSYGGHDFLRGERKRLASQAVVWLKTQFPPDSFTGKVFRRIRSVLGDEK